MTTINKMYSILIIRRITEIVINLLVYDNYSENRVPSDWIDILLTITFKVSGNTLG